VAFPPDRLRNSDRYGFEIRESLEEHLAASSGAHAASAISFSPTGTVAATSVQAAIVEVASEAGGGSASAATGLAKARPTSNITISQGAWNTITMATEIIDVSGWYDTSNSRYTPQQAGYYRCLLNIGIASHADGGEYNIGINQSGARVRTFLPRPSSNQGQTLHCEDILYFNGTTNYAFWQYFAAGVGSFDSDATSGTFCLFEFVGT
jgi:hypothetical protein